MLQLASFTSMGIFRTIQEVLGGGEKREKTWGLNGWSRQVIQEGRN